jgi:hypothetical protein
VERGKKKRAHLGGQAAALRRDVAPAAVRRVGGRDRGEKVGDGRKKLRVGRLFFSEISHRRFGEEVQWRLLTRGPSWAAVKVA